MYSFLNLNNLIFVHFNFKFSNIKYGVYSKINKFFFSNKQLFLKLINFNRENEPKELFVKNIKFLKIAFLFLFKIINSYYKNIQNLKIENFSYFFILNYKSFFFFFNIFFFLNFLNKNLKFNSSNYTKIFIFWYPKINFLKKKKKKSIKKRLKKNFISSIKIY